ncbi:MAG: exonuclease [Spongiibacteraceae bacterium]|nr:exonuclease [Spongiibacteraceae bacterium]|tara:strand:+ start:1810 stop:2436 length:627 start_codon:yes stop_codon:yes gene_type:complete
MDEQRSEEWFADRLGTPSGSRTADIMAKTKSGYGAARKNYMMELLCQRLTGTREEGFTSAAMQRGTDLEPLARSAYEMATGLTVDEVGFVRLPDMDFGASPDGLVGDDGLIEIKCPNTAQHVEFLQTSKPDGRYQWQMLAQMACTGRQWCDFVSFDDRMPEPLQIAYVRFERDEEKIAEMLAEVKEFLAELDALEAEMLKQIEQRAAA